MSKRDQVHYYDQRWSEFRRANNWELRRCIFILDSLLQTGFKQPHILDLGAGAGWLTNILSVFGPAHGVELSPEAVELAAGRFPCATFESADLFEWRVPEQQFDVVVSQEVIEHTMDQKSYLQIVRKALKPGGYLILTTPNARVFRLMSEKMRASWEDQPIENHLTSPHLRRLLIAEKFEIVRRTTVLPVFQERGMYRIFNNQRLRRFFDRVGLENIWRAFCEGAGMGLHIAVLARKPLQ